MKRYILLLAVFGWFVAANATPVSRNEASAIAASFLNQRSVTEVKTPFKQFYIFNGDGCFVIIAADDCVQPVLGYAKDRPFVLDEKALNTMDWLELYETEINDMKQSTAEVAATVAEAWISLRRGEGLPLRNRTGVLPMVKTRWGQHEPFNLQCPSDCVTGCTATAVAQIMRYWEYPNHGIGSHSYYHPTYGNLSANFGAATYDWDHMPVSPTSASPTVECNAVATLLWHVGVSVNMNYGPSASAATYDHVLEALPSYFGYAPTLSAEFQRDYSNDGWKALLRSELDAGRPMWYAGQTSKDAHAFLCDGYDAFDCFHMNWGWSGKCDGYYAIGMLNPSYSGPFNALNYAIIGIQPASYQLSAPENFLAYANVNSVSLSWNAVSGASSYKVYRDGLLIEPEVSDANYVDSHPFFGIHSYYVKAVNAAGDRSPRSNEMTVDVAFNAPAPVSIGMETSGEKATLSWNMPFDHHETLEYGDGNMYGDLGYNGAYDTYWGQRYPISMIADMAGMTIEKVSTYLYHDGDYTLYLGKGDEGSVSEVLFQKTFSVTAAGWVDIALDNPLPLPTPSDNSSDLWVLLSAPSSISYPATYCRYEGPGLTDATYFGNGIDRIYSYSSYSSFGLSWMIKVVLADDAFTYSVSRDGTLLATGLTERSFTDTNLTSGTYLYQVWAALNGSDSELQTTYAADLATIEITVSDPENGTVEGGGLAEIGKYCLLRAVPKSGCAFRFWKENDMEVSADAQYSFLVTNDRRLTACFSGVGVDELDELLTVYRIEIFTLEGVKLETLEGGDLDWKHRLEGYAKGVYLVRMTTDKGLITKKIVR